MKAKKILFPTDFSEHSTAALQHATSLARDSGAVLLIVHVKEPIERFQDAGFGGWPLQDDEVELQRLLKGVVPPDSSVGYAHHMLTGQAPEEIVRLAEEENVDMIIMGTHGRTGLSRLLMGSTAEAVVRRASCPVLTIKQPHNEEAATG